MRHFIGLYWVVVAPLGFLVVAVVSGRLARDPAAPPALAPGALAGLGVAAAALTVVGAGVLAGWRSRAIHHAAHVAAWAGMLVAAREPGAAAPSAVAFVGLAFVVAAFDAATLPPRPGAAAAPG